MAYKIEIIGSSVVVTDTIQNKIIIENPKRDTFFDSNSLNDTKRIQLYNTVDLPSKGAFLWDYIPLNQAIDSDGVAFTDLSFRTFARENLANDYISSIIEELPVSGLKTYNALISQVSNENPTAVVLGNNTIGNIVWTRVTNGFYFGNLAGAFPEGKTHFDITPSSSSGNYAMFRNTDGQIVIRTQDNSTIPFTDADDKLFSNSIRIEVYP